MSKAKKIRIAVMADAFDRRPEHTLFFRHVIEELVASPEFDVTLIHYKPMPDEPLYTQAREVLLEPVRFIPYARHFFAFLRYCLTTKDRYDIVHSFTARLYPFFWLFPARKRVVMAHGGGERLAPGKWTLERALFVAMIVFFQKYIDVIIGVTEYAAKEIIYAFFVPPEKVTTINPHLDETYLTLPSVDTVTHILESEYRLSYGNYFVFIGRLRAHKNVGNLVEAYLRYRESHPEATEHLAIGGGLQAEFEKNFGPIRPSPYVKDIHFLGHIPNEHMPVLYMGARALAFVTLNEGFGIPIIEGFACGTPVITSMVTSMPEVAADSAILVDPRNPDALAEAFALVAHDEALRHELMRRGKERCKHFTWDRVVTETFALFRRVTSEAPTLYNPVRH